MNRVFLFLTMVASIPALASDAARPPTYCNPVNLAYRFQPSLPVRREAADPTMVVFRNEYWLFPSKSGGYWHSPDCLNWTFVPSKTLPIETYAPTVIVIDGHLFWAVGGQGIWANDDPAHDTWTRIAKTPIPGDPALFQSSEGRLFVYGGCSDKTPTTVQELDPHTFAAIGPRQSGVVSDMANRGWETLRGPGRPPYIEGSWMNEHHDTFYLQYAAPGTEREEYGDGVFTSKSPLGPFVFAPYSPFSFKPTGFVRSAGHGSTFQDLAGHDWHVATMLVGVRANFERRVGLFPAGYTADGQLFCDTYLGDYPHYPPGEKWDASTPMPGWMLLSYRKKAGASSTLEGHPVENAFDENIRDWWSAKSGEKGEWLQVDLGKPCRIEAIQTNFADQDAQLPNGSADAYQYLIEASNDGVSWKKCVDRSENRVDQPHDYVQLDGPTTARYVRLINIHCPAQAKLSISGFRIFGNGLGVPPAKVSEIKASRSAADSRVGMVEWKPVANADFYVVRYGLAPDRLFTSYQVYQGTSLKLNALNAGSSYALTVDAINDSGIAQGTQSVVMREVALEAHHEEKEVK